MQITSILKVCVVVVLASASDAVPAYTKAPQEISDSCPRIPGEFATHLANPDDCGSFYVCVWDTAYYMKCPSDLHFNRVLQVCDYQNRANCGAATAFNEGITTEAPALDADADADADAITEGPVELATK